MNIQYSKEEYHNLLSSPEHEKNILSFAQMKQNHPRRATVTTGSTDCIGNNLFDCKECILSYNLTDSTRCRYAYDSVVGVRDCYDVSMIGDQVDLMYEAHACGYTGYQSAFSNLCWTNDSLYYCDYCMSCSHCFGCVGLRNATYCIFNKQFTKQEYETLVPQLIAHMTVTGERGEFFDPSLSPFGYNETAAHQYMPLTKQQAQKRGYARQETDYQIDLPDNADTTTGEELNSSTNPYASQNTQKIIICTISGKPFRLVAQELQFYEKHTLPVPSLHPDMRYQKHLESRPGKTLFLRKNYEGEGLLSVYSETYTRTIIA